MMTNESCTQADYAQTSCTAGVAGPPRRYEIWTMSFPAEAAIHGCRPVIIAGTNEDYGMVTVVPLTSKLCYRQKSTHFLVTGQGLVNVSRGLGELVTTLPNSCLVRRIGYLSEPFDRFALRHALAVHLGLSECKSDDLSS